MSNITNPNARNRYSMTIIEQAIEYVVSCEHKPNIRPYQVDRCIIETIEEVYKNSRAQFFEQPQGMRYIFQSKLDNGMHVFTNLKHDECSDCQSVYSNYSSFQKLFYQAFPLLFLTDTQAGEDVNIKSPHDDIQDIHNIHQLSSFENARIDFENSLRIREELLVDENELDRRRTRFRYLIASIIRQSYVELQIAGTCELFAFIALCNEILGEFIRSHQDGVGFKREMFGVGNLNMPRFENPSVKIITFADRRNLRLPECMRFDSNAIAIVDKRNAEYIGIDKMQSILIALSLIQRGTDILRPKFDWSADFGYYSQNWSEQCYPYHSMEISSDELMKSLDLSIRISEQLRNHSFIASQYIDAVSVENDPKKIIVNAVTFLEMLFNTKSEVTKTISVCVSKILGESIEERRLVFKTIKELYDARSNIVHGNIEDLRKKQPKLQEVANKSIAIIAKVMAKLLDTENNYLNAIGKSEFVTDILLK